MKKLLSAFFLFVLFCSFALIFPKSKWAQSATPSSQVKDMVFCDSAGNPTTNTSSGKIYTAIGCIPVSTTPEFISWILGWAIGIGGGIALMLIIVASFQIISSSGNPEKIQAGKELLTSAIAGLIMLIFSVFILKVIGVDILKLPGLT